MPFTSASGIPFFLIIFNYFCEERFLRSTVQNIWAILLLLVFFFVGLKGGLFAEEWTPSDIGWFLTGGLTAFVVHEGAHMLVAESLGFDSRIESRGSPIPFLVVRYDLDLVKDASGQVQYLDKNGQPVEEGGQKRFVISSAGINAQNLTSEAILSFYPNIRSERRPFLKGMLAFHIATSIGYALIGRKDRDGDLHGMSEGLGVSDRIVGAIVFLPAAVDTYRYFYPDSRWAPWVARGSKGYLLGLSFRW